ncbi:unnamed protein product [Linum trigynum]|uniref:Uncharacterized protein n=1 Tax=Linum trigynum TaxID=586398 RepID=A0AAV2ETF7_9ROSI
MRTTLLAQDRQSSHPSLRTHSSVADPKCRSGDRLPLTASRHSFPPACHYNKEPSFPIKPRTSDIGISTNKKSMLVWGCCGTQKPRTHQASPQPKVQKLKPSKLNVFPPSLLPPTAGATDLSLPIKWDSLSCNIGRIEAPQPSSSRSLSSRNAVRLRRVLWLACFWSATELVDAAEELAAKREEDEGEEVYRAAMELLMVKIQTIWDFQGDLVS